MPSSKRPRSACDSCVLRKCKCDALFPQCSACSKSNRKCFYSFFSQALLGSPVSETQSDSLSINIKATLKTDKANRFGETQFVENPQFMNEIMERVMTLDSPLCPRSPIPYNAIIDKWRYGLIPQTLIDILLATGLLFSYPDLLTKAQALALAQSHLDRGLLCITHSMESLSIYDMLGLHLAIFVVTNFTQKRLLFIRRLQPIVYRTLATPNGTSDEDVFMRKMHDNVGWRIVHNEIVAGASFNEAPKILHMNPSVMHLLSDFYPQSMHTQPTNQDRLALKALSSQGSFYTHTPPTSCYHQSFACLMLILSSVMHLRKTHPDGSAHYLLGEASIEYALDDWQPILRRMRPGVTISTQARLLMLEYAYWGVKMFLFMPSFVRTFNDSCVIKRRAFVKCIDATSKLIRSLRFMTTELNIHFARFPTYAYFLLSNAGLVACAVLRNNLHRNLTWQAAKDLSYIVTILESYTETDTVMRPFLRVLHLKMDEYKLDRKWYRDPDATPRTPKCIVTM